MRTVSDQLSAVLAIVGELPPLDVVLHDAAGCVLAEEVRAPRDLPMADLAALDGYALRAQDSDQASAKSPVLLRVAGDVGVGLSDSMRLVPGSSARVASGALLPWGSDAVLALESTDRGDVQLTVKAPIAAGTGVRTRAAEHTAGDLVFPAGVRVSSRHLALIAALGLSRVRVHPQPRVVIAPIGEELVEPGRPAAPGQVHDANGHALASAAHDAGARAFRTPALPDDRGRLRDALEDQVVRADLIVTTGGLSDGGVDGLRDVLAPLGTVRFDAVAMSPARQVGLGRIGEGAPGQGPNAHGTPILALPGDPVAAQIAFEVFARPALLAMAGYTELHRPVLSASSASGFEATPGVREFVPVWLTGSPSQGYRFERLAGTGPQVALAACNALAVIPEAAGWVASGEPLNCLLLEE